jgi:hypothetical protein
MELFFDSSQALLESLYEGYSVNAKSLISKISQDKGLSDFDRFNKRLKISWGMKIEFTDNLPITREDTRACYVLMLKISDLWFAFEHLVNTACEVIPKDAASPNKVDLYQDSTLEAIGFHDITSNFNRLLYEHVLHKKTFRREVYPLLAYLKNNTRSGTRSMISDTILLIRDKKELQAKHIFALAYGIRNIYVHEGVAAALGTSNYQVKRILYSVLYDALILYSLELGDSYCREKLLNC